MANKMINGKELQDEFLTTLFRAEEPHPAPAGFLSEVMERIALLPVKPVIKPYLPPKWLKWGIPGIILASLSVLLIWGVISGSGDPTPGLTLANGTLKTVNEWFSGIRMDIKIPAVTLPDGILWMLAGALVLTAGFAGLYRFLDKKIEKRG